MLSPTAHSLGNTLKSPVVESLIIKVAPAEPRATMVGFSSLVNQKLGGIAAPVMRSLIDWLGLHPVFTRIVQRPRCSRARYS